MFDNDSALTDTKFIGQICYGKLNKDINAKIEFVTNRISEKYEGLKTTLINNNKGAIDSVTILFNELLGFPQTNDAYTKGVPYIWSYDGKLEWYGYQPKRADYIKIFNAVKDYLDLFRFQGQTINESIDENVNQSIGQSY